MKKVILLLFLLVCFGSISAQKDADGWTILDPNKADKVIYVSSSDGNDSNAAVYVLPSSTIGNDPMLPSSNVKAFKTVEAAISGIENGEAVWVLLKRGDTFTAGLKPRSGKSKDEPFLYSSYGNSNKPPLLKTGAESGVSHCCQALENFWVVGLSFYAHTRDPDSPDYVSDAGDRGIYLETIRGRKLNNILLEGNVVRYYKDNVIQSFNGSGIVTDITFRRNIILDGYNKSRPTNEAVGLFVQNVDGFLLEENIFDHNGWLIPSYGNSQGQDRSNGQASQFSHNTYFVDSKNVTFRNNSFNRPSSNANKWVASGTGKTENVVIENNLYNDCEIGISMGTNYPEGSYRFKNITIRGNVMVDQGNSNLTKRDLSWGIDIDDWDTGSFTDNILASQNEPTKSGFGLSIAGESRNLTIGGNIFYDLKDRRGILISDKGRYQNITIRANEFTYFDEFKRFIRLEHPAYAQLNFRENTYTNANTISRPFVILNQDYEFSEWSRQYSNERARVEMPEYPDPSRDLDRYITEVLGLGSRSAYYAQLRNLSMLNWRKAYTGNVIVNWIRNGFKPDSNSDNIPPVPDSENLPDITGDCSIESVQVPTATDNASGEIKGVTNSSFPIAETTTLIWNYTDEAGNTSTQQQRIIIQDSEPPVLNVRSLPDITAECSHSTSQVPTATDNCDGIIEGNANLDLTVPLTESTDIVWSFSDASGNTVTQLQKVIITANSSIEVDVQNLPDLIGNCEVRITDIPTATVGCGSSINGIADIEIDQPITESTDITWTFSDASGNTVRQSQKVVVTANSSFEVDVQNLPDLIGDCEVRITDIPTASVGCGNIIKGVADIEIDRPITESAVVNWSFTNGDGTVINQQQKVVIEDNTPPVPDMISLPDVQGVCSIESVELPMASDACDGVIVGSPNVQFPISNNDIEEIIWTYTDSQNNSITQIQKVDLALTEACFAAEVSLADFDLQAVQESCFGTNDGAISILAMKTMAYTAKINNSKGYEEVFAFDELLDISNLEPEYYTICLTVTDSELELCETIEILPAEDLKVDVEVDEEDKKAFLNLSGGSQYTIILNGVSTVIAENELEIDLVTGNNDLEVRLENGCQDAFQTTILVSEPAINSKNMVVYPNPVSDGLLRISLRELDFIPLQFNIVTMSGKVVKVFDDFSQDQEEVVIDVSELVYGTFIIQGVLTDRVYTARFIKI